MLHLTISLSARILDISHMLRRYEGRIHAGDSNSEPGTVKARYVTPYGKPPSGLQYRISRTTTVEWESFPRAYYSRGQDPSRVVPRAVNE